MWIVKKAQEFVRTLGYTGRVNLFVTLLWPSKKIIWNLFMRRRNIEFRKHLSNVVAHAKRHKLKKVMLFVDRASYHRTDEVKKFLREHKGILRIKWLPKKDPNSNPAECLVNRRLNSAVCVNRCHNSVGELAEAMRRFLRKYNFIYGT